MSIYDCGNPLCPICNGPDRREAERKRDMRYRRSGAVIYDRISGSPVGFFSSDRDAQQCMSLMEAVAK